MIQTGHRTIIYSYLVMCGACRYLVGISVEESQIRNPDGHTQPELIMPHLRTTKKKTITIAKNKNNNNNDNDKDNNKLAHAA